MDRTPVTTVAELDTLDVHEIRDGYRDGKANEPEPGGNRSKSYWHGWRNGQVDAGHAPKDEAQAALARQFALCQQIQRFDPDLNPMVTPHHLRTVN